MRAGLCSVVAGLVLTAWPHAAVSAAPDLSVGQPFPNLTLPSMTDGRPMSIADFAGGEGILHVFASW